MSIENMILIQRQSLSRGYMQGMYNGLICAHSALSKDSPKFEYYPKTSKIPTRIKIRHKLRKK